MTPLVTPLMVRIVSQELAVHAAAETALSLERERWSDHLATMPPQWRLLRAIRTLRSRHRCFQSLMAP